MMGIGPTEAGELSIYEYTGLLHHWNARHSTDEDQVAPPDLEDMLEAFAEVEASGLAVMVH